MKIRLSRKHQVLRSSPALLLLATLAITGCGDKVPTEWDTAQIMPLEVGNRWIYRKSFNTYSGVVQSYDTIEIVRKERRASPS